MKTYDLIIIGSGPAGITASIYAARYKLDFICIGKEHGGTANEAFMVENYPGLPDIPGIELMKKMKNQAEKIGANIITDDINTIKKDKEIFSIKTNGEEYGAKNIILTTGTNRTRLKVPGEEELRGKGVAYCATCDAPLFRNKIVAVVGGGDAALTAAVQLGDVAEKVYLIARKDLRGTPAWIDTINKNKKIEVMLGKSLKEIKGDNKVSSVIIRETGEEISVNGVFVEIGATPAIEIIKDLGIELDSSHHIQIDESQQTNIKGMLAAGDLTTGSNKLKQIVTACSEGAIAANTVYKIIKRS
ncbi:hypothetical protein COY62_03680 [bacterium (Candidatus Howlettbacteria) CG_4_10_14_0_8_um_filter_40_9]|nr:MAG: hypothetical protein COY62_03680 [bacterium (Candidatus Howlettbacteria) CG_4_10_14_0_8_um_filter_40_9]